jgi:hypothetical protein
MKDLHLVVGSLHQPERVQIQAGMLLCMHTTKIQRELAVDEHKHVVVAFSVN